MKLTFSIFSLLIFILACNNDPKKDQKNEAKEALILTDSINLSIPAVKKRLDEIDEVLKKEKPVLLFSSSDNLINETQQLAIANNVFCKNLKDSSTHQAYRNEIFNVYPARPQEIPTNFQQGKVYKIEMYNYALNLTTTAMVDLVSKKVINVNTTPQTQPDIPTSLKDLAIQIAVNHPKVIEALGYKPGETEALMANTKTALNKTRCEKSLHLCVAPTFIKDDKALWVIVDLTNYNVVGIRWTNVGNSSPAKKISEKSLKYDKIMECYCKQVNSIDKNGWKMNYVITTSDGLRISEVYFKDQLILTSAKIVDWHVSYSNTDGFGYSDAVGCPEYSQAAVVAVSDPIISEIVENGSTIGFALEETFQSEQWPMPCNYNYKQRFEFYNDGRFRTAAASLGRGCGNNGTYRPVLRIAFAGNENSFYEWENNNWKMWEKEKWQLQTPQTTYTTDGSEYKIADKNNKGFSIIPGNGQFRDGGRGDNAYVFITKNHPEKDEGENDLVSIGPCCNTDYKQGPEKYIEGNPEEIKNTSLVVWYVSQMKNEDTKGKEYCWAESHLEHGVYKTTVYPCMAGPLFVPIK